MLIGVFNYCGAAGAPCSALIMYNTVHATVALESFGLPHFQSVVSSPHRRTFRTLELSMTNTTTTVTPQLLSRCIPGRQDGEGYG